MVLLASLFHFGCYYLGWRRNDALPYRHRARQIRMPIIETSQNTVVRWPACSDACVVVVLVPEFACLISSEELHTVVGSTALGAFIVAS
jgi:hypothetical protein